ncbi:SDR family NAD(P)-dependent oxidoreductase [Subtercola sp. PAMC28395]|uniref:SDR family NAD(P)-dependent oxidoreductase n=1 Tax=Subtercola sp. PAMC28395 TaxID=2846775 RepID=UPI00209AD088|nr:SDR family NAD(P)-dependent oxidoreductase [Subtercola sp. PAMC28395]
MARTILGSVATRRTVAHARVLITGAASGMGLLYAERAVAEGARDVILWDRNGEKLESIAARLNTEPGRSRVHTYRVDIGEPTSIAENAERVLAEVGVPDVLINNAGIVRGKYFWEHDIDSDIIETMRINALGPMLVTRAFLPRMIAGNRAVRIVNIASAAGMISNPRMSVYASSKWAVIGWSDSLRLELSQQGHRHMTVTTVAPSYISTGMFAGARGPVLTPIMTPEFVVDRVWTSMLAGKPLLLMPWSVHIAKVTKGLLPTAIWDQMADRVFHLYTTMEKFTGR